MKDKLQIILGIGWILAKAGISKIKGIFKERK
jgi:hypothetical protein